MRKRLTLALAAGALVMAMLPGVASAQPPSLGSCSELPTEIVEFIQDIIVENDGAPFAGPDYGTGTNVTYFFNVAEGRPETFGQGLSYSCELANNF